ncbi:DUF6301 family protein [Nocardia sp. NPDC051030]|uniref:DUF6301 family protein n=1 Tax=Nocardia sp. NPDC051030 TaxID=3155162 RepID=UPI003442A8D2
MQADIAGAVRAVEVAKAFHWTWKDEDVARFCDAAGWHVREQRTHGATLVTDLRLAEPIAFVEADRSFLQQHGGSKESVLSIQLMFTDVGPFRIGLPRELLGQVNEQLTAAIGAPTWSDEDGRAAWYLRRLVVRTEPGDEWLQIEFINPRYQKWREESDSSFADYGDDEFDDGE